MKNKKFQQAIWEIRKQHNRPYLTKKQLSEAFDLYIEAGQNIEKFKALMARIMK